MLCAIKKLILLFLFSGQCLASCQMPTEAGNNSATNEAELLVFVSFSMPKESLRLWSEQAAKVNGKLLVRGFVEDSLSKTTAKTLEIFGEKGGAELLVDPETFAQFNIQMVPAVVVTEKRTCLGEDYPAPSFDVVYGDTNLIDALRLITIKGSAQGKQWANLFLEQYWEKS